MSPADGLPTVAIVGRPNVGKSTLFNRILGRKLALVHDEAGVTRDRHYARAIAGERGFWIVDTGGLQVGPADDIATQVRRQVEFAIDEADVLLFVVDATVGITREDDEIVRRLTRLAKPVLVAANKADDDRQELEAHGLVAGGLGASIPVAALTGRGMDELLAEIVAKLPPVTPRSAEHDDRVRVAIVGRPNVGKSSLVNAILREEKMIVSAVAGTTRDAIDTPLTRDGRRFLLIDTAGLRKRRHQQAGVEYWSSLRAVRAIERCDVAAVVLDATQPIGEQDVKVAAEAVEMDKSVVLVVNKWDAVEKDPDIAQRFEERRAWHFTFIPDAPLVYASAKTGRRADRLLEEAARLADLRARRVGTAELNTLLGRLVTENPPPSGRTGRHTRILYGTQVSTSPPTVCVFTNRPELVEGAYARYLRNRLADELSLKGSGLKVLVRKREGGRADEDDAPKARRRTPKPAAEGRTKPLRKRGPKPGTKPAPKPSPKPNPKPNRKPPGRPSGKPAGKPTGKPAGKPKGKPAGKPARRSGKGKRTDRRPGRAR